MDGQSIPQDRPPGQTETRPCSRCGGAGEVREGVEYAYATGILTEEFVECRMCGGAGSVTSVRYGIRP